MMEPTPPPKSEAPFTTLERIRDVHARLLEADSGDTPPGQDFWLAARAFAVRVAESGIYFGEPHEIKACQGYLSYWGHELSRARAEKQWSGDPQVPELRPYDEAALQTLHDRYANPFEGLATEAHAFLKDAKRNRFGDQLARLIEGRAGAAGLRFELDLVSEIMSQVAGDSFAPKLVEFCLYHLFEDPKTRIGNKLHRPPGERSISCLQYLVDKAEVLHGQQGPNEQQAMLDALSLYGASFDPGVAASDAIISRLKIDGVKGATSPTFRDKVGRTLPLCSFLVSSRLLFEDERGLSIVHPALFRRWPMLLAEIRVRGEREHRRRQGWFYAAASVAVVFGVVSLWLGSKFLGQRNQADANSLAAAAYSNLWKYEACRVRQKKTDCDTKELLEKARSNALEAVTKAPTRRAMMALNEVIATTLGANVMSPGAAKPLALRPPGARVGPCDAKRGQGSAFCFVGSEGRPVNLAGVPGLSSQGLRFGTDPTEQWVAVAWSKSDGTATPPDGTIQLAVFHLGPDKAELVGEIHNSACVGKVGGVRVSPKGWAVTIDCEPSSEDGPLWDLITLSDEAQQELAISRDNLDADRDSIDAIYFASPDEKGVAKGFAKLKDGGLLEISSEPGKDPDIFQTDILRLMGRPGHITFQLESGFAAIGKFGAPLVVVYDKTGRGPGASNEQRDMTFAVPFGLATPTEVNFSPNAKCIEVRTKDDKKKQAFRYHIVLDAEVLKKVAEGMGDSPAHYDAPTLCAA